MVSIVTHCFHLCPVKLLDLFVYLYSSFLCLLTVMAVVVLCIAGASQHLFLTVIVVLLLVVIAGVVLMYCYCKNYKRVKQEGKY